MAGAWFVSAPLFSHFEWESVLDVRSKTIALGGGSVQGKLSTDQSMEWRITAIFLGPTVNVNIPNSESAPFRCPSKRRHVSIGRWSNASCSCHNALLSVRSCTLLTRHPSPDIHPPCSGKVLGACLHSVYMLPSITCKRVD